MYLFNNHLMVLLSLAATAAALLLGLKVLLRNRKKRGGRRPPVGGTVFNLGFHLAELYDYYTDLARRHGSFRLVHPLGDYVYLVDPPDVEYILKTNFANYGKGALNYELMSDLLGDGIFAVDGEKWRQQRKIASFEFSARNLRDYSSGIFRRKAISLALMVSEAANSHCAVEIQDLLMKSTLDSIFKVGFGVELDTLSGSNPEGTKFSKAFDASAEVIHRRYADVFWKVKRFLNAGAEAALKGHLKVIDEFIYKVIQRKTETMSAQQQDGWMKHDILSRFLVKGDEGVKMNEKYLRDIILNLVIAGRDTTAGTLSWFFCMLCKHPEVEDKIAREVAMATGVGSNISMADFSTALTEEALDQMRYLHAAITETLRLYPAVPSDPKVCLSDDTLPGGYNVRKGDLVSYVPYAMGRMKHLWGEDAEEFRPERWLDEKGIFQPESPFKFTAFQAGLRICLGKEFAYRQMKIFAAVLVHFFTYELKDPDKEIKYKSSLTMSIARGLHVTAFHRGANA